MARFRSAWFLSIGALAGACALPAAHLVGGDGGAAGDAASGTGGMDGGQAGTSSGGADASEDVSVNCQQLFVSVAGDDANSGCDKAQPKRTIAAAVATARQANGVSAISICAGKYDEAITLDVPVDLLGGYDCTSWERAGVDAGKNETLVGGSQLPEALRITGASVDGSTSVDGLTVLGATGSASPDGGMAQDAAQQDAGVLFDGSAMRIDSGAAPKVTNCRIRGGNSASISGEGSVGLRIDSGATPEISSNEIDGGSGMSFAMTRVGRVGVYVEGAAPSLHDNAITGGTAPPVLSYGIGSAGLVLRNATPLTEDNAKAVSRNTISGGDSNGQTAGIASAGVLVLENTDVDLIQNAIRPGRSFGPAVELRGVHSQSTGSIRILSNRIFGGDLSNSGDPNLGFRVGVWIEKAKNFKAENNMIYGGVPIVGFAGGSPSFGLALQDVSGAIVEHNTIYSGPSGYPTLGTTLKINAGVTAARVQNNILASNPGWNDAVYLEPCASNGVFERFENNLIFNAGTQGPNVTGQLYGYGVPPVNSGCFEWQGIGTIAELESHLLSLCTSTTTGPCIAFGGVKVSGNRTLRKNCGTDTGCIAWAACDSDTLSCLKSVFAGWSTDQNGLDTLFGPGWKLQTGLPCAITQSSLDLSVAADLFATPRTSPPSMGAAEFDGTCL